MRRRRFGLALGLISAVIAIGYGLYLLGARQGAEAVAPDPYRFAFLVIPVLAASGGWMLDWNRPLAGLLLLGGAALALLAFGLTPPGLILVVLLGGAGVVALFLPDLF